MTNFDRGKGLDVQLGIERAELVEQFQIPILFQRRMQTAHHVHLGDSKRQRFPHCAEDVVNRAFKGVRIALACGESTELTGENTDIRIINVAIEDVAGVFTVLSLPHFAGENRTGGRPLGRRTLTVRGERVTASVWSLDEVAAGASIQGPAILAGRDATALVEPGWCGTVHASGAVVLARA